MFFYFLFFFFVGLFIELSIWFYMYGKFGLVMMMFVFIILFEVKCMLVIFCFVCESFLAFVKSFIFSVRILVILLLRWILVFFFFVSVLKFLCILVNLFLGYYILFVSLVVVSKEKTFGALYGFKSTYNFWYEKSVCKCLFLKYLVIWLNCGSNKLIGFIVSVSGLMWERFIKFRIEFAFRSMNVATS